MEQDFRLLNAGQNDVYEDDNVEERNLEPEVATVAVMDGEALQLRANPQPVAENLDGLDTSLPNGVPRRVAPTKSTFKVLNGNGLAVKHVKGFVRQLPKPLSIQEMHQLLPISSSTQEPQETSTTEALEEDDTSVIDEDAVLEESVTTTTLATTDAPTPTSTVRYTSATSFYPPAEETVVDDDEIEEEVVVVSDMIVLRLPHETFITGCNKHASC
nr:von Willebrand factor domain containing protein [Haemonchus contortus]